MPIWRSLTRASSSASTGSRSSADMSSRPVVISAWRRTARAAWTPLISTGSEIPWWARSTASWSAAAAAAATSSPLPETIAMHGVEQRDDVTPYLCLGEGLVGPAVCPRSLGRGAQQVVLRTEPRDEPDQGWRMRHVGHIASMRGVSGWPRVR